MTKNNHMKSYFSSAHTYNGLVNYSESVFEPTKFDKLYIVKGVFAHDFISITAKKYSCECFINPVEPKKIDAVIINKTAVISGHIADFDDSQYPAVIIDLNNFCDQAILKQHRAAIFQLTEKKREAFSLSQKFLRSANELAEYILYLSKKYLNEGKLISAADRILSKCPANGLHSEHRFISTVQGEELDTLEKEARKIICVSNEYFSGFHFMQYINEKSGGSRIICPDALNAERICAVYSKDEKVLFTLQSGKEKIYSEKHNYINMERFISPELRKNHKQKLKFIKKMYNSIIGETAGFFDDLKEIDTELEKIYAAALDSGAQQKFAADFIKNL